MKDGKATFNVLASIEKHIEALKPLLPKQALVCVGEYPIKTLLKEPGIAQDGALPILIEKSSEEIYKWLPKGYRARLVLGFEDAHIDTHFWYNVLPTIGKDSSVVGSLQRKSAEKLRSAIIFSSVWDGIGSAALPTLIGKFKAANMDTLSIAVLPSKIQPTDAHFNAYAALKICSATDGATVLIMGRDQLEGYEGVDRRGELIKGNMVAAYLLNLFLAKESLVEEISELSRTFGTKLFAPIVVTGASYKVYGSVENMLNTALLKPFLPFDLSTATLLYVVLRLPSTLKESLPRGKIELAITNWFKDKTSLQSIYIAEPIYTQDMTDRIDAVLFVGGFDIAGLLSDLEQKVALLKNQAVEKGFMTEDGSFIIKIEEPAAAETPTSVAPPQILEEPQKQEAPQSAETPITADASLVTADETVASVVPATVETPLVTAEPKVSDIQTAETQPVIVAAENAVEAQPAEMPLDANQEKAEATKPPEKQKRARRTREAKLPSAVKEEKAAKPRRVRRTRKVAAKKDS